ncbi:hypothetical protein PIB30_085155 [Stylosanthes scabra]|uniref:Uncharacterized protein n=1 Tax=Stylosanthes scabra TaxID=79078 RepID=A0ABU6WR41_9FABA|nr:hypothetical protein [Stylosanthes scabra]
MDQLQPLVIRLHPNAIAHERQDGVWFESDSPVVFQHADISTMAELQAVFLYPLDGGFTEIRKVGYRYVQRQPDERFLHLLSQKRMIPTMLRALRSASCPRHVLPAPPPIPRVEDVPCYFQQLDLDEGACSDPLNAGIGNDYNTDGGAEIRVGHRMRNREAVQTAVKNYSIRRNAEYRVIGSDRIKYHCRCKLIARKPFPSYIKELFRQVDRIK